MASRKCYGRTRRQHSQVGVLLRFSCISKMWQHCEKENLSSMNLDGSMACFQRLLWSEVETRHEYRCGT